MSQFLARIRREMAASTKGRALVSIARHRNGVCGAPFYVVIFDDPEAGRMVATVFDEPNHVAVLNISETAAGNIAFANGNSWRGDHYEDWLRQQITGEA